MPKLGQPGSGTSTSSPAETVRLNATCSAWAPPAVTTNRSAEASRRFSVRTFSASAARSSGTPAFGT